MKKNIVIAVVLVFAGIETGYCAGSRKICSRKLPADEKLFCQYEQQRAPAYYTGCMDVYAPESGLEKAKKVCAAEYEQWKENKK